MIGSCQFLSHDDRVKKIRASPTVFDGYIHAKKTLLPHPPPYRLGDDTRLLPLIDIGDDFFLKEHADPIPKTLMLLCILKDFHDLSNLHSSHLDLCSVTVASSIVEDHLLSCFPLILIHRAVEGFRLPWLDTVDAMRHQRIDTMGSKFID